MRLDRRSFLQVAAGSALTGAFPAVARAGAMDRADFQALAFDAFPIFDPRPIAAVAESLFPGQGASLMDAWRVRQFDYQWLRAMSGRYVDFTQATLDSLVFATNQLRLELSAAKRDELMAAWATLRVWPDAADAVNALRDAGVRLAFLSNMTFGMLDDGLRNAGLDGRFEAIISTDQVRTCKPDPRAYQLGVDTLRLPKEEILFVAFAGWDVAGAKWFGYPTYWVNRMNAPREELGADADAAGSSLGELVSFVLG